MTGSRNSNSAPLGRTATSPSNYELALAYWRQVIAPRIVRGF